MGKWRAGKRLGPVGGRIVTEIFFGLMVADRSSMLYESSFRLDRAFGRNGRLGFRELSHAVTQNQPR